METAKSADHQCDTVSEHAQLEKLERLEQEYLRLTHTQNNAEVITQRLHTVSTQTEGHIHMSSSLVTACLSAKKTNNTGHYGKNVKVKGFYLFRPQFEMKGYF